ncbi:MAG: signal peptide peptidase SppA [Alphaproteobacteria bacterium]|nr:signal peptide peptidase SppA [Alphaproteobacteria bacterium]
MKPTRSLFYKPKPRTREISAKRWHWPSLVKRVLTKTCIVIGAVMLFSAVLGVILSFLVMRDHQAGLPGDMILVLNTSDGVSETSTMPTLFDPFPYQNLTVHRLIESIDRAAQDDRVHGLILNVDGGWIDPVHIEEIRIAVERFRATGKKTRAFSPSYGEAGGTGLGTYYLASVFEDIWMQPVGMMTLAGINMETPFVRQLLDKIGIRAEFYHREEFKNAMETFTGSGASPASREMNQSIVDDMAKRMVAKIAVGRGLTAVQVSNLMDQGLFTGGEALRYQLIDRLDYADVMISEWRQKISGDAEDESIELISMLDYAHSLSPGHGKKTVALVQASGMIVPYDTGENVAAADRISDAIMQAVDDEGVSVIVLRVDSPGGSPTASETIRRAVVRAKEKNVRVVVSMGPVAASGGYWISANADKIFALPSTLTGSIGVVMGKPDLSGLWEKAGVNWESTNIGKNAGLWSVNKGFSVDEVKQIESHLDDTYDAFLSRVAEGRKMKKEDVRALAKGRVWTGAQAKKIGLVDELGGLDMALDDAAKGLGLKDRHDLSLVVLPAPETPFEQFLAAMSGQVRVSTWLGSIVQALQPIAPFLSSVLPMLKGQDMGVYTPIYTDR